MIAQSAAAFRDCGYGLWLLVQDGGGDAIGWCGLKAGGDSLPRTRAVWGAALPENVASARVMEQAGLVFEARRALDGQEYAVYSTPAR